MGRMSRTTKLVVAAVAVVVVAAGAFAGWWLFLRDDAPPEVDLGRAVESVGDDPASGTADLSAGVEGSWTVVTDTSSFDFDDTAAVSFVGFRVEEELASIGSATAVGRTPAVRGSITIEGTTLAEARFEADMTAITTNESRRDGRVRSALDTGRFPTATFELTEPVELGEAAAGGGPVSVTAVGDLTIRGVTRSVEFPLDAQLAPNGQIVVTGSMPIVFDDYGVAVPSAPVVLSADDHGVVEVQLFLSRS